MIDRVGLQGAAGAGLAGSSPILPTASCSAVATDLRVSASHRVAVHQERWHPFYNAETMQWQNNAMQKLESM